MKIYFDMDDTLYDQFIPFKKAYKKVFPRLNELPMRKLFYWFRFYSDEVFEDSQNGIITMNEMHLYRITSAFNQLGETINVAKALNFQLTYQEYQNKIQLSDTMIRILDMLVTWNIELGIITNGPTKHQLNKIETLGLSKWFVREYIYISGEVGFAKPDKRIFQIIGEGSKNIYVGDSYKNDVVGAKSADWKCIWLNKKKEAHKTVIPDFEVANEEELLYLFHNHTF